MSPVRSYPKRTHKIDEIKARSDDGIDLVDDLGNLGISIDDGGHVGIGTDDPERQLDVEDGSNFPQVRITHTDDTHYAEIEATSNGTLRMTPSSRTAQIDTGDGNGGNLQFTKSGGIVSGGISWDTGDQDVTVFSEADLKLGAGGSDPDVFIDNGGNVGVGSASPDRRLDVEDGSDVPQVRLTYDGSNSADLFATSNGTLRLSPSSRTVQVDTGDTNGGNLQFTKSGGIVSGGVSWDTGDQDVTVYSEADLMLGAGGTSAKVFIDNGGDVGIGNTDPAEKLDVTGTATVDGLQIASSGTMTNIIDDDTMATASATTLATSESIKAYVDASGGGSGDITAVSMTGDSGGELNVASGDADFTIAGGTGITTSGSSTTVTIAGDNAAADGSTKGVCAFTAADFSASTGVISLSEERVQDIVGGMFSGNTETNITASYEDGDGTIDLVVSNDLSAFDNSSSGFITEEYITVTRSAQYAGALTAGNIYFRRYPGSYHTQITTSIADDATTIQNQYLTGYTGAAFIAPRALTISKISASAKVNAGSGQDRFRVWCLKGTPQNAAAYDGTTTLTKCAYADLYDAGTDFVDNYVYAVTGLTVDATDSISAGDVVIMGLEPQGGSSGATSYLTMTFEFKIT
jgi:hypothetical protein